MVYSIAEGVVLIEHYYEINVCKEVLKGLINDMKRLCRGSLCRLVSKFRGTGSVAIDKQPVRHEAPTLASISTSVLVRNVHFL